MMFVRAPFWLVCLAVALPADGANLVSNGDFSAGLSGWIPWVVRNQNADLAITTTDGELHIGGSDFDAGVYQQIDTGGAGRVVNVLGRWRSQPMLPAAMWAEVWVINADRVPVDGVAEIDGVNGAVLLYRNDTFDGRGAWDDVIPRSSPLRYRSSFVAATARATLILRTGNTGPSTLTGGVFDDMAVHGVPAAGTLTGLPSGFAARTYTFPASNAVSLAQNPVSRFLYSITNESVATNTQLRRILVGGTGISSTLVSGLGSLVADAQGLAFDPAGNLYISTQYGTIVKGTDTNPDPAVDAFTFAAIVTMPPLQIGTLHGVGGIAVGPDNRLYINSGSESHYGYLPDGSLELFAGRLNARILRCNLDGSDLEIFCEGIRNSFDIAFRLDGRLFGVENGPNTGCDYADEFNVLEPGRHYGFPYKYGDDFSGSSSSIVCQNAGGGGMIGPPSLPPGLDVAPAWGNYGPDAVPGPGAAGYQDGGVYHGFHPHSSPDGLCFYEPARMDPTTVKFPPEFHGRAFVARFGNVEPVPKVGFDVLSLRLDDAGEGFFCNRFLGGLGRVVDVLCAYNGMLYVLEYNQQTDPSGGGWGTPSRLHEIRCTVASAPIIVVAPASLHRTVYQGDPVSDDSFTIHNNGIGVLNCTIGTNRPWVAVAPDSGTSAGTSDILAVTIRYDLHGLATGTHTATISVTDPAAENNPQTITVTIVVRGPRADLDEDGDVDVDDFGRFQTCFNGPNRAPTFYCSTPNADLDGDSDVDLVDFARFQVCFNGPNRPPGCS